jgi:hypothetical protein
MVRDCKAAVFEGEHIRPGYGDRELRRAILDGSVGSAP